LSWSGRETGPGRLEQKGTDVLILQSPADAAVIAAEAARNTAYFALAGTIVTATFTVVISLLNNRAARRNQAELQRIKQTSDTELARLAASLRTEEADQDARRDYTYEARKRLYKECEPLLFRFSEASENALHRVYSIARTARNGDLNPPKSWFSGTGYYFSSTLYHLLVPCAVFRLLQEKLTLVDLEVDARIRDQYLLAKWVSLSFTDDFSLAQAAPRLHYTPFVQNWSIARQSDPARYWRQGVPVGRLDSAVDVLITVGANGVPRILTYGEFEKSLDADLRSGGAQYGIFADIFDEFHPRTRPILWRILVVQALLHREMLRVFRSRDGATRPIARIANAFPEELERLDWVSGAPLGSAAEVREPFDAAAQYFGSHLPIVFDALREPAASPAP
jgi:hypothetical protein